MTESSSEDLVETTVAAPPEPRRPGVVRRLYDWTIHWASTPYASYALFLLAFAEASFFPIPPDVLLIAMALGAPRKAPRYAGLCTLGSVTGGVLGYAIGALFFEAVGQPILEFYHSLEQFQELSVAFGQHGFLYIFVAALTPIPYKVFTIAAGVCHAQVPITVLLAASVVGRGLRFFAVGFLFRLFGAPIKRFIDRYFNLLTILFVVLLVIGFLCVKILTGCSGAASAQGPVAPEPTPAPESIEQAQVQSSRGPGMLSQEARAKLLGIARRSVEAAVRREPIPKFDVSEPELQLHQGAFVTLRTDGDLRGCIGRFVAHEPLCQVVREMGIASATQDVRFLGMRIQPGELPNVEIEISVLSPLRQISDPMTELELGKHGIYVRRGARTGCFLPQVADETGWSKEQFLTNCCSGKAGLRGDAWKDPDTELFVFTAEIIHEHEPSSG